MPIAGKLEAVVKFNALPTEATTTKDGWKTFSILCDGQAVSMTLRPKHWMKLEAAVKDWPQWVAAAAGQLVAGQGHGFVLKDPALQVFEKKAKDATAAAPAGAVGTPPMAPPAPATPAPVVASVEPPSDATIQSRITKGRPVEVFVSRKSPG